MRGIWREGREEAGRRRMARGPTLILGNIMFGVGYGEGRIVLCCTLRKNVPAGRSSALEFEGSDYHRLRRFGWERLFSMTRDLICKQWQKLEFGQAIMRDAR